MCCCAVNYRGVFAFVLRGFFFFLLVGCVSFAAKQGFCKDEGVMCILSMCVLTSVLHRENRPSLVGMLAVTLKRTFLFHNATKNPIH